MSFHYLICCLVNNGESMTQETSVRALIVTYDISRNPYSHESVKNVKVSHTNQYVKWKDLFSK